MEPSKREWSPWWHLAMMTLLYCCQGFLQALAHELATVVLVRRSLTVAETALTVYPLMPFSFKFLWSPVVDGVYWTPRTRRPFWILFTHAAIIAWLVIIVRAGNAVVFEASSFPIFVTALTMVVTVSATQDIAVDAWALEGVPKAWSPMAAPAQSVGLIVGFTLVQAAVVGLARDVISIDTILRLILAAYTTVFALLVAYLASPIVARALPPLDDVTLAKEPTVRGVIADTFRAIFLGKDTKCRATCAALLMGAASTMPYALFRSQAVTVLRMPVAFLSEVDLVLTPFEALLGTFVCSQISRRFGSKSKPLARVIVACAAVTIVMAAVLVSLTPWMNGSEWEWRWTIVALTLVVMLVENVKFQVNSTFIGRVASANPAATGTTCTLLASMSNASRSFSKVTALWSLAYINSRLPKGSADDVTSSPPTRMALCITGGVLLTVGAVLQAMIVNPSYQHVAKELDDHPANSSGLKQD
jgi:hypothetical protein